MVTTVWPIDDASNPLSGRELRQPQSALLAGATAARPLGARSGVRLGTPVGTVTATSTAWTVHPHVGVLDVLTPAEASAYLYAVDADVTAPNNLTAADATNPRKDIVYATLTDPAEGTGGSPGVTWGYTAGTASATPAVPATPARSMVLAVINVPKVGSGSPTVTPVWQYSVAAGADIPVRTSAERDAITFATAEYPVTVFRLDLGMKETNYGSGWFGSSIGPWISYTPTVTGIVLGAGGTIAAQWRREGDLIRVRVTIVWGSTASGSQPRISLPVTSIALRHLFEIVGTGSLSIAGGAQIWRSAFALVNTTTAQINYSTSGALADIVVSPAAPAGLTTGDVMAGEFTYRPA